MNLDSLITQIPNSFNGKEGLSSPLDEEILDKLHPLAPDQITYLKGIGISEDVTGKYEIRFEPSSGRYVFPVRDEAGNLIGARKWLPLEARNGDGTPKIIGVVGHNKAALYPIDQLDKEGPLILCEGERDALVLISMGYRALTVTNGVGSWRKPEFLDKIAVKAKGVVLFFDADEAGLETTKYVARELTKRGIQVRVVDWPEGTLQGYDVSDVWRDKGPEGVRTLIENALEWETEKDLLQVRVEQDELKDLIETLVPYKEDPLSLFQSKEWEAARGKISAMSPTLKEATIGYLCKRLKLNGDFKKAIKQELFSKEQPEEELEPWPEPVDGAELANTIKVEIRRFVILEDYQAAAVTLWVFLTYVYDAFSILPLLTITSPTKRCGKTRLLEILSAYTKNGLAASNITPSAVFRVIEKEHPTLLMDEKDTFGKEEFTGILNSGHTRRTASVIRTEKGKSEQFETKHFSTWAPKAIAMIGTPPDTIVDRSIMIALRRKLPDEKVDRLRPEFFDLQEDTRRKLERWAQDNLDSLKESRAEAPSIGNDRAADNWTPLYAIAGLLGEKWPEETERAYKAIETGKEEDEDIKVKLLTDIKTILEENYPNEKAVPSSELVEKLIELEDRPWGEWRRGKPMTPNSLARLLKPFGLKPKKIRFADGTKQGYEIVPFRNVFKRYLPHILPHKVEHPEQVKEINNIDDFKSGTEREGVLVEKSPNHVKLLKCSTCSGLNRGIKEENRKFDLSEGRL